MKVVLTEQQLNEVIRFEEVKRLLKSTISNYVNAKKLNLTKEEYEDLKFRIKYACKILGASAVAIILLNAPRWAKEAFSDTVGESVEEAAAIEVKSPEIDAEEAEDTFDSELRAKQISEVQNYMDSIVSMNGFNPSDLQVSAADFIDLCGKHDFDVALALAQAHVESCFGLNGKRCKETNSIFSVGLYDDGRDIVDFKTQRESIEHYIKIMKNHYLKNKSISELLKPGCFVNDEGCRYASREDYESLVKSKYNKIRRLCPSIS